jgi:hypothetical protein
MLAKIDQHVADFVAHSHGVELVHEARRPLAESCDGESVASRHAELSTKFLGTKI